MGRSLASIQCITSINPIENADNIEKATVLGWQCVVKKGEFNVGDLCVYVEIDSILPNTWWSKFLKEKNHLEKPIRIKTVRLRGQISQGICFPTAILPVGTIIEEGKDVTFCLGITKYEPEIALNLNKNAQARSAFPSQWVPKTDETRIQNIHEYIKEYFGQIFYVTEKIDGISCTIAMIDGDMHVCTRNIDLQEHEENCYWKIANSLDLRNKLNSVGHYFAIQGEIAGPSICGNKLKLKEPTFFAFNAYDIQGAKYLDYKDFIKLMQEWNIKTVPIIDDRFVLNHSVQQLVEVATRKSIVNKDVWMEGLVFRPLLEQRHSIIGRVSFKAINPEFLLKYRE